MNANFIKARIDAVIHIAEKRTAENAILEEWYNTTADAARKIQSHIEKDVTEFENMALALSALQSDVPMVDTSILFNGVEGMMKELDRYDTGEADTAYGNVIKVTKNSLANVGSVIIESIQSLSILEAALGLDKIPEQFILKEPIVVSEKKNIVHPSQICDMHDPFSSEEILNSTSPKTVSEDTVEETQEPAIDSEEESDHKVSAEPAAAIDEGKKMPPGFDSLELPGIISGRYIMSYKTHSICDRSSGRMLKKFTKHRIEYIRFRGTTTNEPIDFELTEVVRLFEEQHGIRVPLVPETPAADKEDFDEYVYIDWLEGIPTRKYRVYKSGKVYDTVHDEYLMANKNGIMYLGGGDRESRTPGVYNASRQFTNATLVWMAFHPETRGKKRLIIYFRDGNKRNCAVDNLYHGKYNK